MVVPKIPGPHGARREPYKLEGVVREGFSIGEGIVRVNRLERGRGVP